MNNQLLEAAAAFTAGRNRERLEALKKERDRRPEE